MSGHSPTNNEYRRHQRVPWAIETSGHKDSNRPPLYMLQKVASAFRKSPLSTIIQHQTKLSDSQPLRPSSKPLVHTFKPPTEQRKSDIRSAIVSTYREVAASKAVHYSNHLTEAARRARSRRHKNSRMATASSDGGDIGTRTQQSPLAAQREKAQGLPPAKGGFFTLGYKEAVSQWVRHNDG